MASLYSVVRRSLSSAPTGALLNSASRLFFASLTIDCRPSSILVLKFIFHSSSGSRSRSFGLVEELMVDGAWDVTVDIESWENGEGVVRLWWPPENCI
jgi:hypothetical protein